MTLEEATDNGTWLFTWSAGFSDGRPDVEQTLNHADYLALVSGLDIHLPKDNERRSLTKEMGATDLVLYPTKRALQFLRLNQMFFHGDRVWFYWQTEVRDRDGVTWRKPVVAVETNGSVVYTLVDRRGHVHVTTNPDAVPVDVL